MGCSNCGSGASGKPAGCKSNGGCSSGGCNKMNVFDWLGTIPLPGNTKAFPIVEISFNSGSRKEYFKNSLSQVFSKNAWVVVEGVGGFDLGQVSLTGELVKLQMKKYGIQDQTTLKRILRAAGDEEFEIYNTSKNREKEILVRSRAIAKELKVDMKISEVELQADGKKATFFYTAEHRVDFRELIKVYAADFKIKVEMRQIGARQESGKVGGIGSCGRELCCSTWLTDFKSVNTTAARYQSLSINQTKLSGQCGRLKCCLNFELDTYMDALKHFPTQADYIQTAQGKAHLIKKDIFRNLMWYGYSGSSKQYPLTIEHVSEILAQNKEGIFPEELQIVEVESNAKEKLKVDVGFVNDVGQITLKNLEKKKSKNRKKPQLKGTSNIQQRSTSQQAIDTTKSNERPQKTNRPNNSANKEKRVSQPQNTQRDASISADNKDNKNRPNKPRRNRPNQVANTPTPTKSEGNNNKVED